MRGVVSNVQTPVSSRKWLLISGMFDKAVSPSSASNFNERSKVAFASGSSTQGKASRAK